MRFINFVFILSAMLFLINANAEASRHVKKDIEMEEDESYKMVKKEKVDPIKNLLNGEFDSDIDYFKFFDKYEKSGNKNQFLSSVSICLADNYLSSDNIEKAAKSYALAYYYDQNDSELNLALSQLGLPYVEQILKKSSTKQAFLKNAVPLIEKYLK